MESLLSKVSEAIDETNQQQNFLQCVNINEGWNKHLLKRDMKICILEKIIKYSRFCFFPNLNCPKALKWVKVMKKKKLQDE